MSKLEELLNSYCSFLQTLQRGSIDQLDTYLAENVFFKDPFHETIGIKKFKFIISSMFLNFRDINFGVNNLFFEQAERPRHASFIWALEMRHRKSQKLVRINGMSFIKFDSNDLVIHHEEFWDPTSNIYELIPIVGVTSKIIRRKISKKVDYRLS